MARCPPSWSGDCPTRRQFFFLAFSEGFCDFRPAYCSSSPSSIHSGAFLERRENSSITLQSFTKASSPNHSSVTLLLRCSSKAHSKRNGNREESIKCGQGIAGEHKANTCSDLRTHIACVAFRFCEEGLSEEYSFTPVSDKDKSGRRRLVSLVGRPSAIWLVHVAAEAANSRRVSSPYNRCEGADGCCYQRTSNPITHFSGVC